jgi:pseudaminic acid biosynthesis-associated methylase
MAMNRQEAFWAGEFGDAYNRRNHSARGVAQNIAFLARALRSVRNIKSCIEFGAGTGMTLQALKALFPDQDQHAIEINHAAAEQLAAVIPRQNIHVGPIRGYEATRTFDLVLTKGVLISVHPSDLPATYKALHAATGRYLLISEYYNPVPVEIPYRGNSGVLWKRDFAGDLLDAFPDLSLVDYGFVYRRDARPHPQDDATWFLLRRDSHDRLGNRSTIVE